jgi:hypothetical protein
VTLSVVQTGLSADYADSGTFTNNVAATNAVVVIGTCYQGGGTGVTFSGGNGGGSTSPTLTYQPPLSGGANSTVRQVVYVFANVPGGVKTFGFTASTGSLYDCKAYEVSGLGASPTIDKTVSNTGTSSLDPSSGTTAAITAPGELVIGSSVIYGVASASPGGSWTATGDPQDWSWAGYQLPSSSGGTFSWSQTSTTAQNWVASIVTIAPTPSAGAPGASFPVVPPAPFSPMAFTRRARPARGPLQVTQADAGTGADTASAGNLVTDTDTGSGADTGTGAPALMQSLTDSFAGSALDANFGSYGTVTVSGNQCAVDATTGESGVFSASGYELTGSYLFAKITPYTGGVTPYTYFQATAVTGSGGAGIQYNAGDLFAYWISSSGTQTNLSSITYSPVNHVWWRIREVSGTTFFDVSPDGINWVNQWSVADPIAYTAMTAQCGSGIGSGTAGNAYLSSFNISSRSQYTWPFTYDSIWNIPVSANAEYTPAGITVTSDYSTSASAVEYNCTDPSQPVKSLTNAELAGGSTGAANVYVAPAMAAAGAYNDCAAFLASADNDTLYQGQTLDLTAGGNPSFGGAADYTVATVSITGEGAAGAHGGSGLSVLGGTLTVADLTKSGPITHAMKVMYNGLLYYSSAGTGYTWPATNADYGYNLSGNANYYGGSNPYVVEGALLALPPSFNPLARYSDPLVQRIATAMQCYGAYIVDNTASGAGDSDAVIELNYDAVSYFTGSGTFSSDFHQLLMDIQVVVNNTSSTPGGGTIGSPRLAPYAPEFANGAGAPPPVTVVSPGSAPVPPVQLVPPGITSPMAWQRQAFPAPAPLEVPSPDSGTGTESAAVTVTGPDAGTGADSAAVTVSGSDAGSGADASTQGPPVQAQPLTPPGFASPMAWQHQAQPSPVPQEIPSQDAGTGTDSSSVTAAAGDSDSSTGADAGSVTVTGAPPAPPAALAVPPGPFSPMAFQRQAGPSGAPLQVPAQDSGTGADTGTIAVTGTDPGAGTDSAAVTVTGADSGTGADTAALTAAVAGSDAGGGADTAVTAVSDTDTGSGADAGTAAVTAGSADTGTGADSGAVTASAGDTDAGSAAETASGGTTAPPPPVTGAGIVQRLNPVREAAAGLDVSLHMASALGAILQFASTGNERLYVTAAEPGVTVSAGIGGRVLGEPASPFPPVALQAGVLYAFGPFHSVMQVPGTSTVQVELSTAYGVRALVVQGPGSH